MRGRRSEAPTAVVTRRSASSAWPRCANGVLSDEEFERQKTRSWASQLQRLPGLQDPHLDLGRELGRVTRELVGWVCGGAAAQVDREEGAPVDRDGDAGAQQPQRLGGRARVQVPFPEPGPPTPHGQQRHVQRRQRRHGRRRRRCRPRSTRAMPASITKPSEGTHGENGPRRARWWAAVAVTRTPDDRGRLPLPQLDDALEAAVRSRSPAPAGTTIGGAPARRDERGQVQVVAVNVRDQDRVDPADVGPARERAG